MPASETELVAAFGDALDSSVTTSNRGADQPTGSGPGAGQTAPVELSPGRCLGSYEILRAIGRGGMGQVYLAEHTLLKRRVALKILNPKRVNDLEAAIRFEREAIAAARLNHPHIVTIHDAQKIDGLAFLVMEYVPGIDLARQVRKYGPLSPELAVACIRQVAEALAYAHRHGVVHRDIKPQNLLYSADETGRPDAPGTVKVLDLGLARLAQPYDAKSVRVTQDDSFIGTVGYMAPEQAADPHRADARSDIYSLGCTLFHLLTGQPVFGGSTSERIRAHREAAVPSLLTAVPEVHASNGWLPDLEILFRAMLAKRPADRPAGMSAVVDRLTRCSAGPRWRLPSKASRVVITVAPA